MAYFLEWCPSEILLTFSVFALSSSNLWNSYWAFQSILRSFGKWWNCLKRGKLEIFLKPFSTSTKDFISTLDKTLLPLAAFGSFHFYPPSQFPFQPSGIVTEKNKTKQEQSFVYNKTRIKVGSLLSSRQRTEFFLKHVNDLRSESERIHHREDGLDIGYQLPLIFFYFYPSVQFPFQP